MNEYLIVDLRHFNLQQSVGKGAFGKVRIIQKKDTKKLYALKYINKLECLRMNAVVNVIQERRLLEEIQHPLCVNLRFAFQDDENLFMALDLMLGGDLRYHVTRMIMTEQQIRFYIAEIAAASRFLHEKRIVHRDLKPDNVLLCDKGHAHLTDFNVAVRFTEGTPLKAVAGTMVYMAPEILKREGYFTSVDWWSLGVLMFELMFGERPFTGKTDDELESNIKKCKYKIPKEDKHKRVYSPECIDVLHGLLEVDVTKRLGVSAMQYKAFTEHSWFTKDLNRDPPIIFQELAKKTRTPPFIPESAGVNFDASHEVEEILFAENTLEDSRQARPKRMDPAKLPAGGATGKYAKALNELETKFKDFNYERLAESAKATAAAAGGGGGGGGEVVEGAKKVQDADAISMHDIDDFAKNTAKSKSTAPADPEVHTDAPKASTEAPGVQAAGSSPS